MLNQSDATVSPTAGKRAAVPLPFWRYANRLLAKFTLPQTDTKKPPMSRRFIERLRLPSPLTRRGDEGKKTSRTTTAVNPIVFGTPAVGPLPLATPLPF